MDLFIALVPIVVLLPSLYCVYGQLVELTTDFTNKMSKKIDAIDVKAKTMSNNIRFNSIKINGVVIEFDNSTSDSESLSDISESSDSDESLSDVSDSSDSDELLSDISENSDESDDEPLDERTPVIDNYFR